MITIEIKDGQLEAALADLQGRLTDLSPVMAQIAEFLLDSTVDRFKTGTGPDGTPWAAKSPTTIEAYRRRKQRVSFRPLIGPTRMLSKESNFSTASGADWARVSSRAIQSAVMQFGAKKGAFGANKAGRPLPWGDIPARPFLGVSKGDEENIGAVVEAWLLSAAKK